MYGRSRTFSRAIPVRSDGKISLPLVGEVQAAGLTPLALEKDIAGKLKNYISEPEVTVMGATGQQPEVSMFWDKWPGRDPT